MYLVDLETIMRPFVGILLVLLLQGTAFVCFLVASALEGRRHRPILFQYNHFDERSAQIIFVVGFFLMALIMAPLCWGACWALIRVAHVSRVWPHIGVYAVAALSCFAMVALSIYDWVLRDDYSLFVDDAFVLGIGFFEICFSILAVVVLWQNKRASLVYAGWFVTTTVIFAIVFVIGVIREFEHVDDTHDLENTWVALVLVYFWGFIPLFLKDKSTQQQERNGHTLPMAAQAPDDLATQLRTTTAATATAATTTTSGSVLDGPDGGRVAETADTRDDHISAHARVISSV